MHLIKATPLPLVIEPEPGNPYEVEGVLNPAAARGPDGELYLFPRLVGRGNYSRVGIMRVQFDTAGDPVGVERLGVALEPTAEYELRPDGSGGCEDPRVTFVEALGRYVMTYTAFSPNGPRIALAVSRDLLTWERLGLATFEPYNTLEFDGVDNKDAAFFPEAIQIADGPPRFTMIHRPLFKGTLPEDNLGAGDERSIDPHRESIWVSHCVLDVDSGDIADLTHFTEHHRLATPVEPWENLKIGCGPPPVRTPDGWLLVYHGVSSVEDPDTKAQRVTYSAGVMELASNHPLQVTYRSAEPIFTPQPSSGRRGTFANVVFPTGLDRRDDRDESDVYDVYYGMNDYRIEVARMQIQRDDESAPS
jgi:beta-1,2-mannobiose phosphorylase / 1,2-beta-oligomannan phosphorylase